MKIAQVSPLYESVPPKLYGGTERVVHYITEELVAQGHDVTLFASGDSKTKANLFAAHPSALRLDESCVDQMAPHMIMIEQVEKLAGEFDIIHSHIDYLYYPVMRLKPHNNYINTLHGRLNIPELVPMYSEYNDIPVVSISDAQRAPLPHANWLGTVYHGLPLDLHYLVRKPQQYLAFLGRISPEKRVDRAIEAAIKTGIPLKIAAKIDKQDQDYYNSEIKHLMDHPLIEYIGEINDHEKQEFLGNAMGLLFLIDWPEPFGLAMIEAMACGTPVIAYGHGSVTEVVDDCISGFIVNSQQQAVDRIERLTLLSREKVRQVFEERFSAPRMARDYVALYQKILSGATRDLPSYRRKGGVNGKDGKDKAKSGLYGTESI
jgi:glycosyltransferase involved in cell wall biosynthesis